MLTRCSFLSIALVLVACSPTLDGSSDESFEASLERVRQAIPEARRAAFDTAMITVGLSDFDLLGGVFTEAASPGQLSRTIRERIDCVGRTTTTIQCGPNPGVMPRDSFSRTVMAELLAAVRWNGVNGLMCKRVGHYNGSGFAPSYRRQRLLRNTWSMLTAKYDGILPAPPYSPEAARFFSVARQFVGTC